MVKTQAWIPSSQALTSVGCLGSVMRLVGAMVSGSTSHSAGSACSRDVASAEDALGDALLEALGNWLQPENVEIVYNG